MLNAEVGYIGLTGGFQETTAEELRQAISSLKNQGMKGIVLDLRGNPGGLLQQAREVVGQFVPKGQTVVSVKGRTQYAKAEELKTIGTETEELPLVVLINKGSASASEIVAGALQDHNRALIVGERSYGKGSVQSTYDLGDGSMLKMTIALYTTPNDRLIQASGIMPEVDVDMQPMTHEDSRPYIAPERDHPNHLEPGVLGSSEVPVEDEIRKVAFEATQADRQLRVAVEHVLAWDKLGGRRR